MENAATTRRWSELQHLNVVDPQEGKILGQVQDFFVKEGSNAIYALSIHTRLYGNLTLPITGIKAIEGERITVKNAQMLIKAVPAFLRGQTLMMRKVVSETGNEVGKVKDIILGIAPVVAMRIAGFEVVKDRVQKHKYIVSVDALAQYDDAHAALIVDKAIAKSLR